MKIALLVTLLAISTSAQGQVTTAPVAKDPPSIREQIKADRARAKADDENAPTARFWDRDRDGKRPWDPSKETPRTKE
jgi:hypothetical protein